VEALELNMGRILRPTWDEAIASRQADMDALEARMRERGAINHKRHMAEAVASLRPEPDAAILDYDPEFPLHRDVRKGADWKRKPWKRGRFTQEGVNHGRVFRS
jgi:hypothetical protein